MFKNCDPLHLKMSQKEVENKKSSLFSEVLDIKADLLQSFQIQLPIIDGSIIFSETMLAFLQITSVVKKYPI